MSNSDLLSANDFSSCGYSLEMKQGRTMTRIESERLTSESAERLRNPVMQVFLARVAKQVGISSSLEICAIGKLSKITQEKYNL